MVWRNHSAGIWIRRDTSIPVCTMRSPRRTSSGSIISWERAGAERAGHAIRQYGPGSAVEPQLCGPGAGDHAESFGVDGRGAFYDRVGTVRDVVQNHLLQLVTLLAMEPSVSSDPDAMRDEKVKVLAATRALDRADLVRGQYVGYRDEAGGRPTRPRRPLSRYGWRSTQDRLLALGGERSSPCGPESRCRARSPRRSWSSVSHLACSPKPIRRGWRPTSCGSGC